MIEELRRRRLPRRFYDRDTRQVARELLGMRLVHVVDGVPRVARIVEAEAYLGPHDRAAHSARGLTARTRPMFGPPGHAYVYLVYGLHHCFNVVTEREGHAAAVLVRAVEPLANLAGNTRGPGLVCRALGIDRRQSGHDLLSDDLFIARPARRERFAVATRPRVGVDYAGAWARRLLRFYVRGNRWVSRP
ncbi:MAG: DNA-3-methyladenine glycosylase [Gammaproteobacteria bacterium]|nr:DNA-3-methyladenine glycosylase [Gammaproteobacteria bacterium]